MQVRWFETFNVTGLQNTHTLRLAHFNKQYDPPPCLTTAVTCCSKLNHIYKAANFGAPKTKDAPQDCNKGFRTTSFFLTISRKTPNNTGSKLSDVCVHKARLRAATWLELFIQYSFHSLFQNMNRAGFVTRLPTVQLQWIQMRFNAKTGPNIYKPGDGRSVFSLNLLSIWFVKVLIDSTRCFI